MKIAVYTLGCKVNQYESQSICEQLSKRGHIIVPCSQEADAYIINSCTVTSMSDSKSKKAVGHFRKKNPDAVIALIGCFPQAFPQKAELIKEADIVVGNAQKGRVAELVEACFADKQRRLEVKEFASPAVIENMQITKFEERTRAIVKIQDGCDRFCSYCIIPTARGRICSKPLDEIVSEVTELSKNGFCEIVLVGIDLSSYGKQFGKTLTDAVEAVAQVEGIKRIRPGSLEPEIISDSDLERLSKIPAFCPQFHLSLQSGCDNTLKRMNRHYTAGEYKTIVGKIRAVFKNASITTDVMVGFAGESDEDFADSLEFVKNIGFLKVHVFPYSRRSGTRADKFIDQIEGGEKKRRARIMIEETDKVRQEILNEQIGRVKEILVESRTKNGCVFGYTENYIPVYVHNSTARVGSLCTVKILSVSDDSCFATAV